MNPFIISLLSAASAFAFVHLADGPPWLKAIYGFIVKEGDAGKLKAMRIKPFDCHTCLAFWVNFCYISFCFRSYGIFEGIAHCFLAMVISQLIYLIFKRL